MSVEENKAIERRIVDEVLNEGNLAVTDEVVAPNYIYHFPFMDVKGPEGCKQFATMMRAAFPDLHVTIDDIIGEGDMVAARATARGTHRGEFAGIAPTGKKVEIKEAVFVQFADGKAVEAWPYVDNLSVFKQLGVSPPG